MADRPSGAVLRSMSTRILIVDDSPTILRILERALRLTIPHLTEVLHTANGLEAIAAIEISTAANRPLSLIFCDLHMPRMGGLDFLLQIQQRCLAPGVPFLMMTADPADPRLLQALAAGAHGLLTKPFTLRQIQARVCSLLPIDSKK